MKFNKALLHKIAMLYLPRNFRFKVLFSLGPLLFLIFAIAATVYLNQMPQDIRERAAEQSLTSANADDYIKDLENSNLSQVELAIKVLQSNPRLATSKLINRLQENPSVALKGQIIFLLGKTQNNQAVPILTEALKDKNPYIRRNAAVALGELADIKTLKPLSVALSDENEGVRMQAAVAIGRLNNVDGIGYLIQAVTKEKKPGVKSVIVESLGKLKNKKATQTLIKELNSPQSDITYKDGIIIALREIRDPVALGPLKNYLNQINSLTRKKDFSINPLAKDKLEITKELLEEAIKKLEKL